jgi:hypothetical protein
MRWKADFTRGIIGLVSLVQRVRLASKFRRFNSSRASPSPCLPTTYLSIHVPMPITFYFYIASTQEFAHSRSILMIAIYLSVFRLASFTAASHNYYHCKRFFQYISSLLFPWVALLRPVVQHPPPTLPSSCPSAQPLVVQADHRTHGRWREREEGQEFSPRPSP